MPETTERRWQMTRLAAGDYLLPSNDGTTLWRLERYEERDGTLTRDDGSVVNADFWMVSRFRLPLDEASAHDLDDRSLWVGHRWMLPTRAAAIAEAMSYETSPAGATTGG